MPVTEADVMTEAPERASYELAFHILPTVTEGEVPEVAQDLKTIITKAGGEITDEEAPAHFTLAYEIEKYLEGRYRKFSSAYFGWVRFTITPTAITELVAEVDGHKRLLRHLCIRLTKAEEANPFYFHEALASEQQVETIDTDAEVDTDTSVVEGETAEAETKAEDASVTNAATDEAAVEETATPTTTDTDEAATIADETPKG